MTKKDVIGAMESLGVYKKEFDHSIERYVALSKEYKTIYRQYEKGGFQCMVESAAGSKKSPVVTTLESLRRDLLQLEESLGLTPRGLLKLNERAFDKPRQSVKDGLI